MSFNSLSNELLIVVIKHVHSSRDLASLSASCKLFSELARPYLYSSFTQTGRQSIAAFLRTISLKPHLARCVKHCYSHVLPVGELRPLEAQLDFEAIEQDENMRDWMRAQLSNELYGPEFCDSWFSKVFSLNNWDAAFALLIVTLSQSLESVSIMNHPTDNGFEYVNEVLEIMTIAQNTSTSTKSLAQLSRVNLQFNIDEMGDTIEPTLSWLRLPSVKTFRGIDSYMKFNFYISREPQILRTSSLSLSFSSFFPLAYNECLEYFHSLQEYSFHYDMPSHFSTNELDYPYSIVIGLQSSAHCLERLTLSLKYQLHPPGDGTRSLFLPCQLRDYKKLRFLDINIYVALRKFSSERVYYKDENDSADDLPPDKAVFFHDCLPDSLEHLIVRDCNRTIFGHLRPLFGSYGHMPPNLKTIKLHCDDPVNLVDRKNTDWEEFALRYGVVLTREARSQKQYKLHN